MSDEYLGYVLEQLEDLGSVTARKMFGGVGLYHGSLFFALIASDVLYFKVDARSRPEYEAQGMKPFKPYPGRPTTMGYFEVPPEILEDREALADWAETAVGVARNAKAGRSRYSKK